MPRTPPYKGGAIAFGCSLTSSGSNGEISLSLRSLECGRTSPIGAKPSRVDSLPNRKSAVAYFDRFTEWRKLALPRSRSWALCPHRRYRRDKPRDGELAAASFAPLELAGFSDGPALTAEITAPPLDVSNPPSHTLLRPEKHDSGKMEKHSWRQFLGISHVMSDTSLVGYRS
jgi:hypothetical protein